MYFPEQSEGLPRKKVQQNGSDSRLLKRKVLNYKV